jgi:Flp pilus assembly protein TadB
VDKLWKILIGAGAFFLIVWVISKILPFLISLAVLAVLVIIGIYFVVKIRRNKNKNKK